MKKWIAGQLNHAKAMCAVLSSWPNSYKRLVPGYEAPVYIAWGFRNRSPLIRVPDFHKKSSAARCEIRCPDPAGNPYLQFAVLLCTGLYGILSEDIKLYEPTDRNVYHLTTKEMEKDDMNPSPRRVTRSRTKKLLKGLGVRILNLNECQQVQQEVKLFLCLA